MRIVKTEVIATALKLLDEVGMEGLTMRKLADALNIQAPSLYWHFANKDALLEGMADALMEPVAASNPESEAWDARLGRVASEVRNALLSRRDAARVFAGTYPLSDNVLRVGSLLIGSLKQAGADDRVASWGAFTLVYFVIGFVIEEQANGRNTETPNLEEMSLESTFPLAAIAMTEITTANADQRFAFGLDLQIEGLKAVLRRC
ncbi:MULTISPECIES: TetR/AcrR family transcriptional regulator C-terminal domain-containing protein [Neorhizobium]|uniref:TetR/AcrR family transcriptional regulator C-terminal domain-containing protein n=1 Tax=Neorhizobium TaxID=1525371 RepID=UPI000CF9A02B|nr:MULTISPECIES: TetR/AcrR family transcriptional regulator C-terminal domain-containing protein [Neorhizobium]